MNQAAQLHADNPTMNHHVIYDNETKLRIHLQLKGVFSYSPIHELSSQECEKIGKIVKLFSLLLIWQLGSKLGKLCAGGRRYAGRGW